MNWISVDLYEMDLYGLSYEEMISHVDKKLGYESGLTPEHIEHLIRAEDILCDIANRKPMGEKMSLEDAVKQSQS